MAAFCTVQDLEAFLQVTIAASEPAMAAIAAASAAMQNYCHQTLELVVDDEVTLDVPRRRKQLFLRELPVVGVALVVEDGRTLAEGTDWRLGAYGILYRLGGRFWATGVQVVRVKYTHGYATLPDEVVAVATRAASRAYQAGLRAVETGAVSGVQGMSLGDYSVSYGSEQSGGVSGGSMLGASAAALLLPSEKRMLDRFRMTS